mgnify:CR=1 FL=1
MKSILSRLPLALALTGTLACYEAQAITNPATIAEFTDAAPTQVLTIHASGWSDPAFGDMGWTHRSGWGKFTAEKGQTVEITLDTHSMFVHPGVSVWYRDAVKDTIDDKYVFDHFYAQMANQYKSKATDETTGAVLGNLVMKNVKYGYDLDGKNNLRIPELLGIRDKVQGKLTLRFQAPNTGVYIFAAGGINPGDSLFETTVGTDGTLTKTLKADYAKVPTDVTVTVTTP